MQFEDVVGQEHLINRLKELVDQNRLSHALLFIGREGSGALPLALAMSTYIIEKSEHNRRQSSPAGLFGEPDPEISSTTPGVLKATQYLHPDIHYSMPVIKRSSGSDSPSKSDDWITEWRTFLSKHPYGNLFDWLDSIGAENKQGKISAAECEEIARKLYLKSFEGGNKILIQWLPEMMGNEGNKLLKLIEEPPPDTIFLLVTENEDLLLPTIVSRCQAIRVPPVATEAIAKTLEKQFDQDAETALQTAQVAEGNYREALRLVEETDKDWQGEIRSWLNMTLQNKAAEQVKWIEKTHGLGREYQKQLLRTFLHLIELSIRLHAVGEKVLHVAAKDKDFALRLNQICSTEQLEAIAGELDKAVYYIERNANGKMLFMALTIRMFYIIKHKTALILEGDQAA
jgi:DNA polymerase-3 subunit delta'